MVKNDLAIRVRDLSKQYMIYARPEDRLKQAIVPRLQKLLGRAPSQYYTNFLALNNVSLDVRKGETVGIIGRNGSGKSTLLQIICGTLHPTSGEVNVNGRVAALLELGAGFNPEFSGRENVYMNGAILGLSQKEIDARFAQIAAFADIGQFIDQPVKTYSSGMYVRLAFSVAINVDPDILVIDEALAVGDVAFQRKCFARLEQIRESGATILFVSHSTASIIELCDRAILMDGGEILLDGKPKRVTNHYLKLVHMPAEKVPEARERIRALQNVPDDEEPEEQGQKENERTETNQTTTGALRNGATRPDHRAIGETAEDREKRLEEEEGWFDPNLKSQSVVEYESRGARIRDVRILAPSGRQVNVLKMGVRYTYEYFVDFHKNARNVAFGMTIKTLSGLELGGSTTGSRDELRIKKVESGTTYHVKHSFECRLMPGTYFLNAGSSGITDETQERVSLHRLIDALMFRVADEKRENAHGIINFDVVSKANPIMPENGD